MEGYKCNSCQRSHSNYKKFLYIFAAITFGVNVLTLLGGGGVGKLIIDRYNDDHANGLRQIEKKCFRGVVKVIDRVGKTYDVVQSSSQAALPFVPRMITDYGCDVGRGTEQDASCDDTVDGVEEPHVFTGNRRARRVSVVGSTMSAEIISKFVNRKKSDDESSTGDDDSSTTLDGDNKKKE